jgi:hypothetical protein
MRTHRFPGNLIAIEDIDGAGKTERLNAVLKIFGGDPV